MNPYQFVGYRGAGASESYTHNIFYVSGVIFLLSLGLNNDPGSQPLLHYPPQSQQRCL
jgi:hypothetical protein